MRLLGTDRTKPSTGSRLCARRLGTTRPADERYRQARWPRPLAGLLLTGLLLTGLLLAAPAAAEWKEDYKAALEALEAGESEQAESLLRAAIADRGEEKSRLSIFQAQPYLPHYYLGVALATQGDCAAAVEAWNVSTSQGEIAETDRAGDLESRRSECQRSLAQIELAAVEAEQALERARKASSSARELSRQPELAKIWGEGTPSLRRQQEEADRRLSDASRRAELASRSNDREAFEAAAASADEAREALDAVIREGRSRLGEINAATADAMAEVEKADESARRLLQSIARLAPYPPNLGERVRALKAVLAESEGRSGSVAELEQVAAGLVRETRRLRSASAGPPRALRNAAEAFLRGEYEVVIETFADELPSSDRARFHALLLRAAARFQTAALTGGDIVLRSAYEADLAEAVALEGELGRPGPSVYPPAFLELYERTRAAADLALADLADDPSAGAGSGDGATDGR